MSAFLGSQHMVLRPGLVLAGKYSLVREIGRGAVGLVFEAEHLRLRQRFAVKALNGHLREEKGLVERFEREARAMASLKSPFVTSVFDVDILADGTPYMVMELLEGNDLHRELRERPLIPIGEIVRIVLQACEGVAVVHAAGIVHRDLKPSNLFLAKQGNTRIVKVMDFGISKLEGENSTHTGSSLGTPAYMSPEQVRSPSAVDARSDVWSLGVIMFRAITGQLPFEGEGITGMAVAIVNHPPRSMKALRPDVPDAIVAIVERMLDKDPLARYPSVLAVREALVPFADEMPIASLGLESSLPLPAPSVPILVAAPPVSSGPQASFASLAGKLEPTSHSAPPGVSSTVSGARRRSPAVLVAATVFALAIAAAAPWVIRATMRDHAPSTIPPAVAETPPPPEAPNAPPEAPPTPQPAVEVAPVAPPASAAVSAPARVTSPPPKKIAPAPVRPHPAPQPSPAPPAKKQDLPNLL